MARKTSGRVQAKSILLPTGVVFDRVDRVGFASVYVWLSLFVGTWHRWVDKLSRKLGRQFSVHEPEELLRNNRFMTFWRMHHRICEIKHLRKTRGMSAIDRRVKRSSSVLRRLVSDRPSTQSVSWSSRDRLEGKTILYPWVRAIAVNLAKQTSEKCRTRAKPTDFVSNVNAKSNQEQLEPR